MTSEGVEVAKTAMIRSDLQEVMLLHPNPTNISRGIYFHFIPYTCRPLRSEVNTFGWIL